MRVPWEVPRRRTASVWPHRRCTGNSTAAARRCSRRVKRQRGCQLVAARLTWPDSSGQSRQTASVHMCVACSRACKLARLPAAAAAAASRHVSPSHDLVSLPVSTRDCILSPFLFDDKLRTCTAVPPTGSARIKSPGLAGARLSPSPWTPYYILWRCAWIFVPSRAGARAVALSAVDARLAQRRHRAAAAANHHRLSRRGCRWTLRQREAPRWR